MGVRDSGAATESGNPALKALRQLMVRGIPLKLMHLRPTSRMSSAMATLSSVDWEEEVACWKRMPRESGEFMVIVAAVY